MILDEKYRIEKSGNGLKLIEKSVGYKKKDKDKLNPVEVENEYYYGALYQALRSYTEKRLINEIGEDCSLYEIGLEIEAIKFTLALLAESIKKDFCVYVNTTGEIK